MATLKYQDERIEFDFDSNRITAVIGGTEVDTAFSEILLHRDMYFNGVSLGVITADCELDSRLTLGDIISKQFKIHKKVSRKRSFQAIEEILTFLEADNIIEIRMNELSELQLAHAKLANAIALRPEVVLTSKYLSTLSAPVRAFIKNNIAKVHSRLDVGFLLLEKRAAVIEHLAQDVINFHPEKEHREINRKTVQVPITPNKKADRDEISGLDFVSG